MVEITKVDTKEVLGKLKKSIARAAKTKLKMRKIIKKGKRVKIIVNVPEKKPTEIIPQFKQVMEEERKQLFFA